MRTGQVMIDIDCELDAEYSGEWDSLSDEIKEFWNDPKHKCNCEGSGVLSSSCRGCSFCEHYQEQDANEL